MTLSNRGFREPSYFVLASLLEGPRHGYGIIKQAAVLSEGAVRLAPGTLYGALERLSESALIEACGQEVVSGRPRHYYRLTELGRQSLVGEAHRLAQAARTVLEQTRVIALGSVAQSPAPRSPQAQPSASAPASPDRTSAHDGGGVHQLSSVIG